MAKKQIQELKPDIFRIEELVIKVREGDIKLPKFQRPFVWKRKRVLTLFDSIYRGYPIGSILLWLSSEKLSSEKNIGDLIIKERNETFPTYYLLDGQQRLSSLCGALFWDEINVKSLWNVAFDLEKEEFVYLGRDERKIFHFPINKLLATFDFIAQCRILETDEKNKDRYLKNAEKLLRSIKDYKIASVIIGEMSINQVAPIFERINSTGRQLTIVDLMRAATWSDKFDLTTAIMSVSKALELKEFDSVPETHILRNISASCGLGIFKEAIDKLRTKTPDELKIASKETSEAYKLSVDFLSDELLLASYGYLPYGLQLTLLVEFFRLCPKPTITQREKLKKWFWDTSFCRHFGVSNTGQQKDDLDIMRAFARNEIDIPKIKEKIRYRDFVQSSFKLNTAVSKTFGLLLASNSPKNLLDGSTINIRQTLSIANQKEYHHIFPRNYLKGSGYHDDKINMHSNICLLNLGANRKIANTRPSVYFKNIKELLGNQLGSVLESNYLNNDSFEAAANEDYEKFIEIRSSILIKKMKELVSDYQKIGMPDDFDIKQADTYEEDDNDNQISNLDE